MSYNIQLFSIKTKENEQRSADKDFFDNQENLIPFTPQQFLDLKERLLRYNYELTKENGNELHFSHPDEDFGNAMLTGKGLYFTADWNEAAIFEVGMRASEFTDTNEFAKYDPQQNGWEEI